MHGLSLTLGTALVTPRCLTLLLRILLLLYYSLSSPSVLATPPPRNSRDILHFRVPFIF